MAFKTKFRWVVLKWIIVGCLLNGFSLFVYSLYLYALHHETVFDDNNSTALSSHMWQPHSSYVQYLRHCLLTFRATPIDGATYDISCFTSAVPLRHRLDEYSKTGWLQTMMLAWIQNFTSNYKHTPSVPFFLLPPHFNSADSTPFFSASQSLRMALRDSSTAFLHLAHFAAATTLSLLLFCGATNLTFVQLILGLYAVFFEQLVPTFILWLDTIGFYKLTTSQYAIPFFVIGILILLGTLCLFSARIRKQLTQRFNTIKYYTKQLVKLLAHLLGTYAAYSVTIRLISVATLMWILPFFLYLLLYCGSAQLLVQIFAYQHWEHAMHALASYSYPLTSKLQNIKVSTPIFTAFVSDSAIREAHTGASTEQRKAFNGVKRWLGRWILMDVAFLALKQCIINFLGTYYYQMLLFCTLYLIYPHPEDIVERFLCSVLQISRYSVNAVCISLFRIQIVQRPSQTIKNEETSNYFRISSLYDKLTSGFFSLFYMQLQMLFAMCLSKCSSVIGITSPNALTYGLIFLPLTFQLGFLVLPKLIYNIAIYYVTTLHPIIFGLRSIELCETHKAIMYWLLYFMLIPGFVNNFWAMLSLYLPFFKLLPFKATWKLLSIIGAQATAKILTRKYVTLTSKDMQSNPPNTD